VDGLMRIAELFNSAIILGKGMTEVLVLHASSLGSGIRKNSDRLDLASHRNSCEFRYYKMASDRNSCEFRYYKMASDRNSCEFRYRRVLAQHHKAEAIQ